MIVVLLLLVGADQPDTNVIRDFVEKSKAHTVQSAKGWDAEVKAEEVTLAAVKRGRIDGRGGVTIADGPRGSKLYSFQSAAVKQQYVEQCEKRLEEARRRVAEIKAGTRLVPAQLPYEKLEIGQMGTLVDNRIRVRQVVDDRNLLGEVTLSYQGYEVVNGRALPQQQFHDQLVWISGVPTGNFLDGGLATCPQVFWACGTRRYQTAIGGSKQVLELRAVDVEQYLNSGQKPTEQPIAKPVAKKKYKKSKGKVQVKKG